MSLQELLGCAERRQLCSTAHPHPWQRGGGPSPEASYTVPPEDAAEGLNGPRVVVLVADCYLRGGLALQMCFHLLINDLVRYVSVSACQLLNFNWLKLRGIVVKS